MNCMDLHHQSEAEESSVAGSSAFSPQKPAFRTRFGDAAGCGLMSQNFTCATSLVIIPNRFLNFRDDVTRDGS